MIGQVWVLEGRELPTAIVVGVNGSHVLILLLKPAMIIYYAIIHTGGLRGGSGTLLVKTYIFGL